MKVLKAKEIMIGNWVTLDGKEMQIVFINSTNFHQSFQPIPLTEEWLLKLGFEKKDDWYVVGNWSGLFMTYGLQWYLKRSHSDGMITTVKQGIESVHELQNLYYALTGEELKLSE